MRKESRKFPRVPGSFETKYRVCGDFTQSWHLAKTLDLSAVGIRLLADQLLEGNMTLEIQITLPSLYNPLFLNARVVWVKTAAPDMTECGVEFSDVSTEQKAQIDALVAFLSHPPKG